MLELLLIIGLAIMAFGFVVSFNQLIAKRQMTNNGWADIDVQLKRRADLIPQLVTTVQAYAAHERQLFADIAEKRTAALAAGDNPAARGAAESALQQPVSKLIAVAEAYPDLKASQNFLDLQHQLADTEDKIELARRFYNGAVRELNILVEAFPSNLIAKVANIQKRAFFEIAASDRSVPSVST